MTTYEQSEFGATHNSYSGGVSRGSALGPIRCVELDFHDNGYDDFRDYRVGHGWPGDQTAFGDGNPTSPLLRDWLGLIRQWSVDHEGHVPITIVLDAKDDLTDNDEGGDLEDLNETLQSVLGGRLFTAEEFGSGPWPDVNDLKEKILCVLSGNEGTRVYYRWTRGSTPSIVVNTKGDVVLAYQSTAKDLRCWTGRVELLATGIQWRRRATYRWSTFPLSDPAVAINEDGWVVAVHGIAATSDFPTPVVESRVGRLQGDGGINWFSSDRYALGREPTVQITGDTVRSIFRKPSGSGRQVSRGRLDPQRRKVKWGKPKATTAAPFPRDVAQWESQTLRCAVGSLGEVTALLGAGTPQPVRFRQIAFSERQAGESSVYRPRRALPPSTGQQQNCNSGRPAGGARGQGLGIRHWRRDRPPRQHGRRRQAHRSAVHRLSGPVWGRDISGSHAVPCSYLAGSQLDLNASDAS
jgi:hypothetical protein